MNLFQRAKRRVVPEETPVKRVAYTVKTGRDFDGAVSRFMKARDALEEAKADHEFTRNELMDISIDKWAESSKTGETLWFYGTSYQRWCKSQYHSNKSF